MGIERDFIFLLIGFIIGCVLIFVIFQYESSQIDDKKINDCLMILHKKVINDVGNAEIYRIVNISSTADNNTQQLNKIADLILENYSAGLWDNSYKPLTNSNLTWYNQKGQIYIAGITDDSSRFLSRDPNWLIYQKSGACHELSILFNDIARKAGFTSQVVRTGDGLPGGENATHWWNEVAIDGINKTFDVLKYGQIKYNKSNGSTWYGKRSDFENNSDGWTPQVLCDRGGVWITDDAGYKIEDITIEYTNSDKCSMNTS
jgi:hypothetical protein